jgi:hypothetical protein
MRRRAWLLALAMLFMAGCGGELTSVDDLQRIMNDALGQFVQRVITDPDITARLTGGKRPE